MMVKTGVKKVKKLSIVKKLSMVKKAEHGDKS